MADSGISAHAAMMILKIKAQTLEECAEEIVLDRPDLVRKWRGQARDLRQSMGEPDDDESGD